MWKYVLSDIETKKNCWGYQEVIIFFAKAKNISGLTNITSHKPNIPPKKEETGTKITSPIIGTAYLAPEPGAKKFIEVGAQIKKGQTVMIVEAMKTMNHVPSTSDGVVKKILVQDGEAVEFGQTLVLLK